jgi:hypothetical protein
MFLTGEPSDPNTSNLPLSISNSILTPKETDKIIAGQKIVLTLETRTTDASKRTNYFFSKPEEQIKLTFASS